MEIVRFGVGHRRPEGPRGSHQLTGQVIVSDACGGISELAFARHGSIEPHANPNATWFVVIEGGGFVRVGDEQTRIAAGEAVLWPPGVLHAAWTEQSQMRAIVVEFAGEDPARAAIVEGRALAIEPGDAVEAPAAEGRGPAATTRATHRRYDPSEGEPF